jgi:hypothetical protein
VVIVVDFDGTVVARDAPLRLLPGAKHALLTLKRAGHTLLLCSARSNRAQRFNPELDPLVRAGVRSAPKDEESRQRSMQFHNHLHMQMVNFIARELPGVFDAIDDGEQGKPIADLYIDDRSMNPRATGSAAAGWAMIAATYGEPVTAVRRRATVRS